jgi:hypothetical protein
MRAIDEKTWIEWRCKLGCRKAEARSLFREYQELLRESGGTVRMMTPRHNESWEQALTAFLDQMPRKPIRFLAMVAEVERRRSIRDQIKAHKADGRRRYEKRYARKRQVLSVRAASMHGSGQEPGSAGRTAYSQLTVNACND